MITTRSLVMQLNVCLILLVSFTSCDQQQTKPEGERANKQESGQSLQKVIIPVEGMTCSACQGNVKHSIETLDGVYDVKVSLKDKMAYVSFDTSQVNTWQIRDAINKKGYKAGRPQIEKQ